MARKTGVFKPYSQYFHISLNNNNNKFVLLFSDVNCRGALLTVKKE
jgi:hypothetical protein